MSIDSLRGAFPFTTVLLPYHDDPLSLKVVKAAGIAVGLWSVALFPATMCLDALSYFCRRRVVPEQPLVYSAKGLTAVQKLAKQLTYALDDPKQGPVEKTLFVVDIPNAFFSCNGSWGVAQSQGGKRLQEDGFLPRTELTIAWGDQKMEATLYGVFDGHRDSGQVSQKMNVFLKPALERLLSENWGKEGALNEEAITNSLVQVFAEFNREYREEGGKGGATVTCALQIGTQVFFPNIGDSQAILIGDQISTLTENATVKLGDTEHLNTRFTKWQIDRGHYISDMRINGRLNISRDVGANPEMNSRPKITRIFLGEGERNYEQGIVFGRKGDLLLLASDGLFEAATVEAAALAVGYLAKNGVPLNQVAQIIAEKAGSCKGNDNVTVMVIRL